MIKATLAVVVLSIFSNANAESQKPIIAENGSCEAKIQNLVKAGVSLKLLEEMAAKNQTGKAGKKVAIVDFSLRNTQPRLFVIDRFSADLPVQSYLVSHGKGSDPSRKGKATKFDNRPGAMTSKLGMYQVAAQEKQMSKFPGLVTVGMDETNSAVKTDYGIAIHPANYVSSTTASNSFGDFAVDKNKYRQIRDDLKGSVIYAGLGEGSKSEGPAPSEKLKEFFCAKESAAESGSGAGSEQGTEVQSPSNR